VGGNLHQPFGTRLSWHLQSLALRLVLPLLKGRSHSRMERVVHRIVRRSRPLIRGRIGAAATGLKRVYGESLDPAQRTALAERSLEHFLLACLESVIQPVDDRIVAGGEGLDTLLHRPQGQGAIVASLHLGCWDVALRYLSQRLDDLAVIYRPIENPGVDRLLNRARSGNSRCHWISRSNARAMLAWLRRGGTLVVMSDLHAHRNCLEVDMLGRATRISSGPFRLAQATGSPIFPVAHVRDDDGGFRLHCGTPIPPPEGPDGPRLLAQELCRWQEHWIHQYAEQYLWAYPRWRRGEGAPLRDGVAPSARVLSLARG
jgi:KDO2-lipid IV(A) lauroyltransferase